MSALAQTTMFTTKLDATDILPLTCSRTGTCCHGKQVLLNPWELRSLAFAKNLKPAEFRDQYCESGGIRLRFDGKAGWKDQSSCSQYIDNFGCSVHSGRPLSCRLYPLGRQIQNEKVQYVFQGEKFPCVDGCPIVLELPQLSVGQYLEGQQTDIFEKAQDAYLEIMQQIADIAFMLLLETGLAESGDKSTLQLWRKMGSEQPQHLAFRIGSEWMDYLMVPQIHSEDQADFTQKHLTFLQSKAQEQFGILSTMDQLHEASVLIMGVALQMARSIGANPQDMAELWIETAKKHGAGE